MANLHHIVAILHKDMAKVNQVMAFFKQVMAKVHQLMAKTRANPIIIRTFKYQKLHLKRGRKKKKNQSLMISCLTTRRARAGHSPYDFIRDL